MAENINGQHYAKKSFFELQAIKEDHYPFLNTIHIVDLFLALTGKQLQTVNYMLGDFYSLQAHQLLPWFANKWRINVRIWFIAQGMEN